jgi:hypothetical protein
VARPLWASVLTSKSPAVHGAVGESRYQFPSALVTLDLLPRTLFFQSILEKTGVLRVEVPGSTDRRTLCYWDFFARHEGLTAGIVDLYAPVRRLHGFLSENPVLEDGSHYLPPEMKQRAQALAAETQDEAKEKASAMLAESRIPTEELWKRDLLARALWSDETTRRIADSLETDVVAFRLRGLDLVSHYLPAGFAGEEYGSVEGEEDPFEHVIEQYHVYCDGIIGSYMSSLPDDTMLCVISVHGTDPLPPWTRLLLLLRERPVPIGGHERGPDGFVYFYGRSVASGTAIEGATLFSILPTLLYYQGLPVGMDMEGSILLPVFSRSFKETHPASYVPTHEVSR